MSDEFNSMNMNFPGNSHRSKESKDSKNEKKVEKVIKGKAIIRKKSFGKKLAETFIGEDMNNVFGYVLYDVLIPAAKNTIEDVVKGGIEMILFPGEKRGSRVTRDRGSSYVSYNNFSGGSRNTRQETPRNRSRHNLDDISLETRGEAEEVLSNLIDLIVDYGSASVADLYGFVGITEQFTDHDWGWTDLRSASVSRSRNGGYVLNLPKTVYIK